MKEGQDHITYFFDSLDRASNDPKFLDYFYDGFTNDNEEINEFFKDTDMDSLKQKLKTTLRMCTMVSNNEPGISMYMEHLGRVHHRLNIGIDLYAVWLEALLSAVEKCDPEYDEFTRTVWNKYIVQAISILTSQYPSS